jgi:protein-L-isoaspartate O-methyltransferase
LKQKGIIKTNLVFYTLMSIERRNFIPQPPYYIDKARGIGEGAIISAPHMHAYAL